MKDNEIQLLIDKYLEGTTSPAEEKRLAAELLRDDIPKEWEPIRLMLGELTLGEALYDRILAEREQQQLPTVPRTKPWGWVAMMTAVASLAIILMIAWPNDNNDNKAVTMAGDSPTKVEEKKKEDPIAATDYIDVKAEAYHTPENKTVAKKTEVQTTRTNQVNKPRKKNNVEESDALDFNNSLYEDTLGTGIWKNEKNVSIAMELLKDCEKSIGQSHKAIRNGVVEASFNALPHSPNMQLVIDEEGNYVITEKTQPSPVRL